MRVNTENTDTNPKYIYVIVINNTAIKAAKSLLNLIGRGKYGKSYYYYYRKLKASDTMLRTYNGNVYKIQRVCYG